jgi:hyaluronoglucosaminidase
VNTDINAGVIEGFFGRPWGWPERFGGAEFLRDNGFEFYIYAPKADAFLRRRWREPLPAEVVLHLSQLAGQCRKLGISFGIGLTPFEIYLNYDSHAQSLLRSKVRQINEIGADLLCILFDDMRGDIYGLADLQGRVILDVCSWSTAARFIACPTY